MVDDGAACHAGEGDRGDRKDSEIIPFSSHAPAGDGQGEGALEESAGAPACDRDELKRRVEALLFAADKPLSSSKLAAFCGAQDGREVRSVVKRLQEEYDGQGRAFQVAEIGGGFQLLTRPEYHSWVKRLQQNREQETLSQAALETLAIIAYRQPILRAEIEDIRGVQTGHILRSLAEKGLVRVTGRSEEIGRPLLYGTSREFLNAFGLRDLSELPSIERSSPAKDAPAPDGQQ